MHIPLTRMLPLRDSTAWGRFASIQAIPRVYGQATISPVPYDDSGRLFVLADHAIHAVVSVLADGSAVTAYRLYHQPDTTGKTVAFLELQTAISIGQTALAVTLEGLLNPVTGRLMVNPGDVVWDVLQWATGHAIDRNIFARFSVDCAQAGLEINGALTDQSETIRSCIDRIMDSCCAVWSTSARNFGIVLTPLVRG